MKNEEFELVRLMNPELLKFNIDIMSIPSTSKRIEYFQSMMMEMYLEGLAYGWSYGTRDNSNYSSSAIMRLLEVNARIRVPGERFEKRKGGRKSKRRNEDE